MILLPKSSTSPGFVATLVTEQPPEPRASHPPSFRGPNLQVHLPRQRDLLPAARNNAQTKRVSAGLHRSQKRVLPAKGHCKLHKTIRFSTIKANLYYFYRQTQPFNKTLCLVCLETQNRPPSLGQTFFKVLAEKWLLQRAWPAPNSTLC